MRNWSTQNPHFPPLLLESPSSDTLISHCLHLKLNCEAGRTNTNWCIGAYTDCLPSIRSIRQVRYINKYSQNEKYLQKFKSEGKGQTNTCMRYLHVLLIYYPVEQVTREQQLGEYFNILIYLKPVIFWINNFPKICKHTKFWNFVLQ